MTLFTLLTDAANEIGITPPTSVVGSTTLETKQLLALAYREAETLRMGFDWPQLTKEYTFSTANGTANYALPADFDRFALGTFWDRTNHWELLGPITATEWQQIKSGVVSSAPRRRFRVKGVQDNRFYLDPTPTSTDTLVFEYISQNWILPLVWTASATFTADAYCSYNGNIYKTSSGGVTGSTAPTHITTTPTSDGGVPWTYQSAYTTFNADTDTVVLKERLVGLGVQWRFKRAKGLEWESLKREYDDAVRLELVGYKGARELDMTGRSQYPLFLSGLNIPDSGFGV